MEEKLTIKQLFAILAAGLFSFCGSRKWNIDLWILSFG